MGTTAKKSQDRWEQDFNIIAESLYKNPRQFCNGKQCYDKKTAQTIRNSRGKHGTLLRIYPCDVCNRWHLTHKL
jgi:hypothetical protein